MTISNDLLTSAMKRNENFSVIARKKTNKKKPFNRNIYFLNMPVYSRYLGMTIKEEIINRNCQVNLKIDKNKRQVLHSY